jgi:putative endonuclease
MREHHYYVYILQCADGSYYTGVTNNVASRVAQHQEGANPTCYTFRRRPLKLMYTAHFQHVLDAIHWEKVLKRWSRKKKEAVIAGEWEKLPELAKKDFTKYKKKRLR